MFLGWSGRVYGNFMLIITSGGGGGDGGGWWGWVGWREIQCRYTEKGQNLLKAK